MLNFENASRFDSPDELPTAAVNEIDELVGIVCSRGDNRKRMLEHFKWYFARAMGGTSSPSSDESWAQTDLDRYMRQAAKNAPLFIEAFYDACTDLKRDNLAIALPDLARVNRGLAESGYEISPPNLVSRNPHTPVSVPDRVASLTEQARDIIKKSLTESERLLVEGRARPAVQEILWLLESVVTAFQGIETEAGTIQGDYFNKIAGDLQRHHKGKVQEQVLLWIKSFHGFLSSPTGGRVRHGTNLKDDVAIQIDEAWLFCNLTRSYIAYLMAEHERLSGVR
jgi:hypothetical protein